MSRTLAVMLLTLSASFAQAAEPIAGSADFERHVIGILGKSGCSAGTCHGSFQGKGGLQLSLFGYDPAKDYLSLSRGGGGRRINLTDPDKSLLLLKATGQISHGGGKRFDVGSWQAKVLRDWITAGARHVPGSGTVEKLEILPEEHILAQTNDVSRITVQARFTDGSVADVTLFCELRAKDDSVIDVSPFGELRATRPGDTAIVARYRGLTAIARAYVPLASTGKPYPLIPETNEIDKEVFIKLKRLNVIPSELATDEEFLARVTIDTTGGLPSPAEVRAFLADRDPQKREKLIDRLLKHPLHAALWATKMCDITGCNVDEMSGTPDDRARAARMWHDWFRLRFADNVHYDKIARGVLTATSREGQTLDHWITGEVARTRDSDAAGNSYSKRQTLDLFWKRFQGDDFFPLEKMAELTATAFLGVRLECAQCHRHPFDRWTQTDYRAFANTFARVRFENSPELTAAMVDLLEERRKLPPEKLGPPIPRIRELFLSERSRGLPHPINGTRLEPKAPGGPELSGNDPRESLLTWMVRPDNRYFARAFVNRVWAHYFGIGLVDPVDDLSSNNPASNERLLETLAARFIKSGFDIRLLERAILVSRTYQLSSTPNESNRSDRSSFSRSYPRRSMAEVVLDVLNDALGTQEDFGRDARADSRAVEVATNRVRAGSAARMFRVFGRPMRTSTCECERPSSPALPETLFLMTEPAVMKKMSSGGLAKLIAAKMSDARIVEELFLATLSRLPDEGEKAAALDRVSAARDREAGLVDILWALVNTREFIVNH